MKARELGGLAAVGGLLFVGLSHLTCHQVILTAPPGSTLSLFANPEFIAAHGDISVISALVMEPNGTPVADGTVVQFFTNLGRIDEQGKTNDGVARVNLTSDSRSGTATVTAVSGGGGGGGGGTTTTTTTSTLVSSTGHPPSRPSEVLVMAAATGGEVAAVAASDTVTVVIGSARPARVVVAASPSRITSSRSTDIVANVFDKDGNPVANVPVIFSVTATGPSPSPSPAPTGPVTETMDSGGEPIFTDTNGQAQDVMRTRYPRDAVQKTVTVTATTPNGISGSVTVTIN